MSLYIMKNPKNNPQPETSAEKLKKIKEKVIKDLIHFIKKSNRKELGKIIEFDGIDGNDVYNITAPFMLKGKKYIAGRVEKRESFYKDSDYNPEVIFFVERNGIWTPAENAPKFSLEDPFNTFINDEIVFGGVEIFRKSKEMKFKTVFFKGKDLNSLEKFASGPDMMKDIRLVQLSDGRIGVFTRPQGGEYKRGRIGFTLIDSLQDFTEEKILKAKIIRNELKDNEWEGVNEAVALESGRIGVLAHFSNIEDNGQKHYQASSFIFDPFTSQVENFKIIAKRDDFQETAVKCHLKKCCFPGRIRKRKRRVLQSLCWT